MSGNLAISSGDHKIPIPPSSIIADEGQVVEKLPIKSYNYFTFVNFQIKLVQENIFIMAISLVTPFSSWTQMLGANIMVNFNGSSLVDQANTLLTESSVNIFKTVTEKILTRLS